MSVTFINPGPSKFPEGGGKAPASAKRGNNILDTVLGVGCAARTIDITAQGPVEVFMNDEVLPAHSTRGDIRRFYYQGEGQGPGGTRYGTIRTLEIVGSGQFSLLVT